MMIRVLLVLAVIIATAVGRGAVAWIHGSAIPLSPLPLTVQAVYNCPIYPTTVMYAASVGALSDCVIDPSPNGVIMGYVTGEATCGALSTMSFLASASLSDQNQGANFIGSISNNGVSNTLTVSSWVAPAPTAPYNIQMGQFLMDTNSGSQIPISGPGSALSIGTNIDSTHWNVTGPLVTIASEPMWSLAQYGFEGHPPSSATISGKLLELTTCENGTKQLISYPVNVTSGTLGTTNPMFITVLLTTEATPSVQSGTFKGQVTLVTVK